MKKKAVYKFKYTLTAAALALLWLAIYLSMREIHLINRQIKAVKAELNARQTIIDYSLPGLINNYRYYSSKSDIINKALLDGRRQFEFITNLENIAQKYNLTQDLDSLPYQKIKGGEFKIMPVQITLTGTYQNALSYLRDLERLPVFVNIKNLDITAGGQNSALVKSVIIADTFWR